MLGGPGGDDGTASGGTVDDAFLFRHLQGSSDGEATDAVLAANGALGLQDAAGAIVAVADLLAEDGAEAAFEQLGRAGAIEEFGHNIEGGQSAVSSYIAST